MGTKVKGVAILGSTGSVGVNSLDVIRRLQDRFSVVGLSANVKIELLFSQAKEFGAQVLAVMDPEKGSALKSRLKSEPIEVFSGIEGLIKVATYPEVDIVVNALVGAVGLIPTLKAIQAGKRIALANKESLVMAGELVTREAREHGVQIIPVDSEHSAIFQCLQGRHPGELAKIILTASGGPFLDKDVAEFDDISLKETLAHPTWTMGPKITVDSATLMNKGLEVIEAHWLFGVPLPQIEVVIHPQSIIHSMIELVDGSVIAQLAVPDMRLPIQYALTFPERLISPCSKLDFSHLRELTFRSPEPEKFVCLKLAYQAAQIGGTMPAVLNAANEIAVRAFLAEKLSFNEIPVIIEETMNSHVPVSYPDLEDILSADRWAREVSSQKAGRRA